jgi:hypothetical protein
MKEVEYWRWRYRDVRTGQICRTMFQLTAEEAAKYPEAERIAGSLLIRTVDGDAEGVRQPRHARAVGDAAADEAEARRLR